MALLFISKNDDPEPWRQALLAGMPELDFRVWPDVGPAEDITAALAWKPPPGTLAGLPNLRAVFSLGAGVDGILKDPTLPASIPLVRMVDPGLTEGMTEHVVLRVLEWHRQSAVYRAQQAAGRWRPLPQQLARHRRVGVLGLGVLGADAASALAALRFRVAGWSRSPKWIPDVLCLSGQDSLARLLAHSEILVCLLPLTDETRGILDCRTFEHMPRGAYLINAARGGHLVEEDLLVALDSGQIAGAALDVFQREPLPDDHPFWTHRKITITPHIASVTHPETASAAVLDGLRRIAKGEPLINVVDRRRGY